MYIHGYIGKKRLNVYLTVCDAETEDDDDNKAHEVLGRVGRGAVQKRLAVQIRR
jgi:hypothetical protein